MISSRYNEDKFVTGVHHLGEDLNEFLIDNMAIEIAKKMHSDGVVLNENVPVKELDYPYTGQYAKDLLPPSFLQENKDVIFPVMLDGK